jgi:hypothetical protein
MYIQYFASELPSILTSCAIRRIPTSRVAVRLA